MRAITSTRPKQKDSGQFPDVEIVPHFYNATTKIHVERFIRRVLD